MHFRGTDARPKSGRKKTTKAQFPQFLPVVSSLQKCFVVGSVECLVEKSNPVRGAILQRTAVEAQGEATRTQRQVSLVKAVVQLSFNN